MSIQRINLLGTLLLMSALAFILFVISVLQTKNLFFMGLNWNLFLAWIPIFLALYVEKKDSFVTVTAISVLWLLFFPNAPYIITDLVHLTPQGGNLYWHHQIMIFSYAFVSLACGLLSLYWMQRVWTRVFSQRISFWAGFASIGLSGYGIFLGRIERLNSWDLFVHPFSLVRLILHSARSFTAILMTVEFSLFIGLAYWMFYSLLRFKDE
ncbi:MAG: DUF1361 domain-containing protein [Spirosomataceae bacterium]